MKLKHLTIAVAAALGLSTAAMAQTGDMGKRDTQRGAQSDMSTTHSGGMGSAGASEDVRHIQQELQNRGYNPGTIDGVMGPQTKGAIKEFQQAEGMPATGELNQKTKDSLKAGGSSAAGTTKSSSGGETSNPNAPSVNGSNTPGAASPATPGSAPRGGSAGSGVKGAPSPNAGTTGSTSPSTGSASPNTGSSGMTAPGSTTPRPSTDKPKTGDSSK